VAERLLLPSAQSTRVVQWIAVAIMAMTSLFLLLVHIAPRMRVSLCSLHVHNNHKPSVSRSLFEVLEQLCA
jgi:hypothetical protein